MLPVPVDRSFYDGSVIRYVLPVLWMTSCFHALGQIQIHTIGDLLIVTRWVESGLQSAILELPCSASYIYHGALLSGSPTTDKNLASTSNVAWL